MYARLEPADPPTGRRRSARLHWSNAGHLPPIVLTPEGQARLLTTAVGVPIGVEAGARPAFATTSMPAGSTLLLYTDGLVGSREGDIETDIERLRAHVERHSPLSSPDQLVADLVAAAPRGGDDIAVLAVKVL